MIFIIKIINLLLKKIVIVKLKIKLLDLILFLVLIIQEKKI